MATTYKFFPSELHAVLENRCESVSESFVTLPAPITTTASPCCSIRGDVRLDHFEIRSVDGVLMAEALDLFDQSGRRDSFDRGFAGGIDIQNQNDVRQIESPGKVVEQMKCSGKAVRLKDGKDAFEIAALRGAERRADLRRVMRIVVDDGDAVARFDLEPAVDALESFKAAAIDAGVDVHIARRGESGRSIQNVVHAGNTQSSMSEWMPPLNRTVKLEPGPAA